MEQSVLRCMAHNCNGALVKISASCCSEVYQCQKCGRRMKIDINSAQRVYGDKVKYSPYNRIER